jgi:cytochrome c-type biogenesis protein CcmF
MNISSIGDLALFLTMIMGLLAGVSFFITASGKRNLAELGRRAYELQFVFALAAAVYLFYLIFSRNFSVAYVYQYTSSDQSFFYTLAAFWAGQEGTYLLWLLLTGLFGFMILKWGCQYTMAAMGFYSIIILFFSIVLLNLSPFALRPVPAAEGAGLNPLLMDPWMVIHPPVMFTGFALAGVPFALALAAMLRRDFANWTRVALPYVLGTSLFLLAGNAMGGYWAYKTLGWGGYWAWDPVENTSFVPWVISLALIHGFLVERRSGALRRSNLLMACFVFLLTIYGTFLTRSGVLADFSVHSFVDMGINTFLVFFLLLFTALILIVFFSSRVKEIVGKPLNYNIMSREFILFVGMMLLFVVGIIVEFWASLPLVTRYLTENPSAAEMATYNAFAFPLAILIALFLTLTPLVTGVDSHLKVSIKKAVISFMAGLVLAAAAIIIASVNAALAVTVLIYFGTYFTYMQFGTIRRRLTVSLAVGFGAVIVALVLGARDAANLLFIGASAAAVFAQIDTILRLLKARPLAAGGYICHFGFGLMLLGIISSSAYSQSEQVSLPRGEVRQVFGYDVIYRGMDGSVMNTNNELFISLEKSRESFEVRPHYFFVSRMNAFMKRPHIEKSLLLDLYISPIELIDHGQTGGLKLIKGEARTVGDYQIKFIGFDMGAHGEPGEVSVGATLEVTHGGRSETITPRLTMGEMTGGRLESKPISLFSESDFKVRIDQVSPMERSVVLDIPGLAEVAAPDELILDISKKPGISLLWIGTILALGGVAMIAVYRGKQ